MLDEPNDEQGVEITHPFHPLRGQRFEFLHLERPQGEPWAVLRGNNGVFKLPLAWTDAGPVDAFVLQSAGRSFFRPTDLLAAVELLRELTRRE